MFKCKNCDTLERHNRYLQKIVEKLLAKQGVELKPVPEDKIEEIEEEPKEVYGS